MKKWQLFLMVFMAGFSLLMGQSTTENYIKSYEPKSPFSISQLENLISDPTTPSNLTLDNPVSSGIFEAKESITLSNGFHATGNVTVRILGTHPEVLEHISYTDGLGRPVQRIAKAQSPDGYDVVSFNEYDKFGRRANTYLAYPSSQRTGNLVTDPLTDQQQYYSNQYNDQYARSENRFDGSPLNRVIESASPGQDWQIAIGGHTTKMEHATNTLTNEIIKFTIDDSGNSPVVNKGGYGIRQLFKNIVKNTDWKASDGLLNTVESYTDKSGRLIAKVYYEPIAGGGTVKRITQHVYDVHGRLRFLLPPKALVGVNTTVGTFSIDDDLVYRYEYDDFNRRIAQKVPGKGWEFTVYDQLDRPLMTQDANLAASNQWLFTKSDVFGRVVYSGIYTSSKTRDELQTEVDNFINANPGNKSNFEKRTGTTSTVGGIAINYTNNAFPVSGISEVLSVNYYDDYNFNDSDRPVTPNQVHGQAVTTRTKGLQTANFTKVIGQSTWAKIYSYYDEKGREIKLHNKNHLGGYTATDSKLDFRGKTDLSVTKHKRLASDTELVINDRFTYDYAERTLGHFQKVNNQSEERISEYEYDELGLVTTKKVGGVSNSASALQQLEYDYNIRGQLLQVNDVNSLGNDLFAYKIHYNQGAEGGASAPPRYDGNIAQTIWRSAYDGTKRSYAYNYDKLNRLQNSKYQFNDDLNGNTASHFNTQITYDENGNLSTLSRNATGSVLDQLSYSYGSVNGNQLVSVSDAGSSLGFSDGNTSGNDYAYDANGNMTMDLNKGIQANGITYNHLDLVKTVSLPGNKNLVFQYDASGAKVQKRYMNGSIPLATTDYLGGFQYTNTSLQFFPTPEGYVYKTANGYKYMYIYADHLGNNRVSYTDVNGNGAIENSELSSNRNYYPFGGVHTGQYTDGLSGAFKYTFQGKEFQDEEGLNWHDFGSRMYDPGLGRWMATDPQNQFGSPYLAMGNNPINSIDPNGEYTGIDDAIAALVGGTINLVANWNNIDSFGDGAAYFGIGAGAGVASLYGSPLAGAAILSAGNSAYTQYDKTGSVSAGQLLLDTGIGVASYGLASRITPFVSSHTAQWFGKSGSLFSKYAIDAVSNTSSGIIVGTFGGYVQTGDISGAFKRSLEWESVGTSLAIGAITTTSNHYQNKYYAKKLAEEAAIKKATQDKKIYDNDYLGKNPYEGIKEASELLQSLGVKRSKRLDILNSFEMETISLRSADTNTMGLRWWDFNKARQFGGYLFPTFSNNTTRAGLGLKFQWNNMINLNQFQIKPGSIYLYGRASSQGLGYPGGANQMYVPNFENNIIKLK